jgi:glycosyltransferase 2 family protein
MRKNSLKIVQLVIGCAVSFALIYWIVAEVKWSEFRDHFTNFRFIYLLPVTGIFCIHFILRAWRWRLLLTQNKSYNESSSLLYDSIMVGNLATFILPFRAGEFIRPYMLSRCSNRSFASSFVSVVLERFFDLSTVLICFVFFLQMLSKQGTNSINPYIFQGAYGLLSVAIAILIFILASVYFPNKIVSITEAFFSIIPKSIGRKVEKFVIDFVNGALVLRNGGSLVKVIFLSLLIWFTAFLRFWVLLMAFPNLPESFLIGSALGIMVSLAVALPSAPGFVGVYEGACILALTIFGVSESASVAFGFTSHILEYVLIGIFGSVALYRNDLNLIKLSKQR